MKRHFYLILLACLAGWLSEASAQEEPSFRISFSPYPLKGEGWSGIYYQDQTGKMIPVRIIDSRGMRSPEHTYIGESPLRFYRMKPNAEGVDVPVEVASVTLDRPTGKYLMMFVKRPEGAPDSSAFVVFKMDDDRQSFPAGHARFFNACPETLYIAFGADRFRLQSGTFSGLLTLPANGTEGITVQMLKADDEGNPLHLLNKRWRFTPNSRELIILVRSGTSDLPLIYQLTDL